MMGVLGGVAMLGEHVRDEAARFVSGDLPMPFADGFHFVLAAHVGVGYANMGDGWLRTAATLGRRIGWSAKVIVSNHRIFASCHLLSPYG